MRVSEFMERKLREKLIGGKFENVSITHSKRMGAIKGKGNKTTERLFKMMLVRAGLTGWKVNPRGIVGNPDVYFSISRVAVFLDGCFWHGCPECGHIPRTNSPFWQAKIQRNQERDKQYTDRLEASGIHVVRIWEHELQRKETVCLEKLKVLIQ